MDFLDDLMGGGQQQQDYQDFADRYDQGHPAEGYSDEEVINRHQELAAQLPPEDYQQAAYESFQQLTPDERMQLAQHLQDQGYGGQYFEGAGAGQLQDPAFLAQMAGQMHAQQPGLLGTILGGGMGGMTGGGMYGGGSGMGGMLGGGGGGSGVGGLLSNPAAKAALAGIARYAFKRMTNR